jgi:hypothetical protein
MKTTRRVMASVMALTLLAGCTVSPIARARLDTAQRYDAVVQLCRSGNTTACDEARFTTDNVLALLSPRDPARSEVIARAAEAYSVSVWTIYRALRELTRPKSVRRSDRGSTRAAPVATMERYAEIIAALKIRTSNKKGCHLSTAHAIRLLEEDGVETPEGLVRAPFGLLKRATVDRVLRASGLDYARVTRPVAAVRFQAKRSNELWPFDMSPSDLKQVEAAAQEGHDWMRNWGWN